MPWPLLALLALATLTACEQLSRTEREVAALRPAEAADDAAALQGKIAAALSDTQRHLRSTPVAPSGHAERRCPDLEIAGQESGSGPIELVVRTVDARIAPRSLLPLEVIARLETDDFSGALQKLAGGRAALWDPAAARPVTREAGRAALEELRRLRRTRLVAELRIRDYAGPNLFFRKGATRREWAAGFLAFDLVIYDLVARSAMCQAPGSVRGDASTAPVSRRLREQTRVSLQRQLADRTWAAMGEALGRISERLKLPDPTLRAAPSQRFSSSERPSSESKGS